MDIPFKNRSQPQPERPQSSGPVQVVVATSVMLSFISFWRAAAIVLNDLGSSAFYAGGIAETAVGSSSPWYILAIMLFSYAVRAVYVESCAMFTRGGVYRVVKEAMGGTLAKLSVSALMFDYILTGPISGVSAGQYVIGLIAQTITYFGHPWNPTKEVVNLWAAGIAIAVTLYFWWRNTKGLHESSEDALKIMRIATVMVVILILWGGVSILSQPANQRLPPFPLPKNLFFSSDAIGWLIHLSPQKFLPTFSFTVSPGHDAEPRFVLAPSAGALFGLLGILVALGHSFLAMSGEESLAQVNRELEYPKHKNLMRAGLVIFIYSLLFTSLVSFFAYALIPDGIRHQYSDNLISGISMYLVGPTSLKLIFQAFIVFVGFLMLSGAVNTAIIGSNGVLNRLSEDGVLTDWFRQPHRKYGTSYRMINLIVIMQLITIIASRGEVYLLGEAYAFGIVWSFAFKGLSMFVLRFKSPAPREWKVPFNLKFDKIEIPLGLGSIALFMFAIAIINLLTKQVATVSGLIFTLVFFTAFWISEHLNEKKRGHKSTNEMEKFRITPQDNLSAPILSLRPSNVICLVRDYQTLEHLRYALDMVNTQQVDLVVMTIRRLAGPDTGYQNINEKELFTDYEQLLFTKVVSIAEKAGKHVELLVVPSSNIFQAIALTAAKLHSSQIIAGKSSVMEPEEQARQLGKAWEQIPTQQRQTESVDFRVIDAFGNIREFYLGAHLPKLQEEDVYLIHQLWLDVVQESGYEEIHHRDIVKIALIHLSISLSTDQRKTVLDQFGKTPPHHLAHHKKIV